jgi:iron only hydrogenase large subunit-like protein
MDGAWGWWKEQDPGKVPARPFFDVDWALTTRELARMIKLAGIDISRLPEEEFDDPLGQSTGAGTIFGTTGGVMEAALRTVYELVEKKPLENIEFTKVRGFEAIKTAEVVVGGSPVRVAVAHGLANARVLLDEIRAGKSPYHFIEIMSCPAAALAAAGSPFLLISRRNSRAVKRSMRKTASSRYANPMRIQPYVRYTRNFWASRSGISRMSFCIRATRRAFSRGLTFTKVPLFL